MITGAQSWHGDSDTSGVHTPGTLASAKSGTDVSRAVTGSVCSVRRAADGAMTITGDCGITKALVITRVGDAAEAM